MPTQSNRLLLICTFAVGALCCAPLQAETYRLYDGLTAFVPNPDGRAFTVTLDVRDINHRMHGPSELLVKIYGPDGRPVVRELIPDDGILAPTAAPPAAGWDHEAWYYATCYSRGIEPLVRWSAFSDPQRLAALPARRFAYDVEAGAAGVYRLVLVGSPDHYVDLNVNPDLSFSLAGSPEWVHGHGNLYRRSFVYVPRTTRTINVLFMQYDEPAQRSFRLLDESGAVLASGSGANGLTQCEVECGGARDEQVLTVEVTEGPGDFLLNVTFQIDNAFKPVRAPYQAVTALFSPDAETARATQGGAIYHDGEVFWQMHQVRLHDWLTRLEDGAFEYPAELNDQAGFISVGSHNSPTFMSKRHDRPIAPSDLIMHSWHKHRNEQALNAAIGDMLFGLRLIGHSDHVAIGPLRNLAYEMGCYTFFWYRPAWRIVRQTDAPEAVKDILREFAVQAGDRLAFARTVAAVNGNAFASLMAGVRYCAEASQDPMQQELFDTICQRFTSGGYGERVGIGPSGGLQESFGYDFHYGSYVLRGWRAIVQDLEDPRFAAARDRILNWFSYVWFDGPGGNQWSSRTSIAQPCGGSYDSWDADFRWKGHGGPDITEGVGGHNEWFAARRAGYYMLTYHGRLSPTWLSEGFHGQVGYGGGGICQLHVIGKGQVLGSKPNDSYGGGMHVSQWRNFHIHSVVGATADGQPLVTANSEHWNAALEGDTVTSSGPVRQSSVAVRRGYTYGPTAIRCAVSLTEAHHDNAYGLWAGRPVLRGKVTEAYEMIPFADLPKRKGRSRPTDAGRTAVTPIAPDGMRLPMLTDESVGGDFVQASAVLIDRGGYGAMLQFAAAQPVARGENDTLLIRLTDKPASASDIALDYHIVPFSGDPPEPGELVGGTRPAHGLARIEPADDVARIAESMAAFEPRTITANGRAVAQVRLALAGDALALAAEVVELQLSRNDTVWKASDIEVFGAMPGSFDIGQVFLAPALDDTPAGGYRAAGKQQVPEPAIRVASQATEQGYALQALVPLTLLKLDPAQGRYTLEVQVSTSPDGKKRVYPTLFGSEHAYENSARYGLFQAE